MSDSSAANSSTPAESLAPTTTASLDNAAQTTKDAEYLTRSFHVRQTDGTMQGPFTGAVIQSLYKHRKLEPYWEISEDQTIWTVAERIPWLKRGFDAAKIGELADKLGEKSADLQRKAAPVVAEFTKRATPVVERIKHSPKIAFASVTVLIVLLYLLWPTSNRFHGSWVGIAKMPLLGSEMVTATINGTSFTMIGQKSASVIGTLEITGDGEARLTGLSKQSYGANPKDADLGTGLVRLIGRDRMDIMFPGAFLEISLNKAK